MYTLVLRMHRTLRMRAHTHTHTHAFGAEVQPYHTTSHTYTQRLSVTPHKTPENPLYQHTHTHHHTTLTTTSTLRMHMRTTQVSDGVHTILLPPKPLHAHVRTPPRASGPSLAYVGGNCSILGFDGEGTEEFWTVCGDTVRCMMHKSVGAVGKGETGNWASCTVL